MQHWGPPSAVCSQKGGQLSFLRLSASDRGSCQRGKARGQAWHRRWLRKGEKEGETLGAKERRPLSQPQWPLSLFLLGWGGELLTVIYGGKKSFAWEGEGYSGGGEVPLIQKHVFADSHGGSFRDEKCFRVQPFTVKYVEEETARKAASEVRARNTKLLQSGEIPHQHLLLIPTMKAFDSWCTQGAAQPPTSPRSDNNGCSASSRKLAFNAPSLFYSGIPAEFEPGGVYCRFVLSACSIVRLHLSSPVLCLGLNHFCVNSS